MLDENLPVFHIRPSAESPHNSTLSLSQYGSELEPAYSVRKPDPALPASKNCYSIALFDSHNPDVLFAEVLVRPSWTQQSMSGADARRGEVVPAPPVPVIPNDFTIQLYAPDQQVHVKQKQGSRIGGSPYWEFELPQDTFRQPSGSSLDRSRDDPGASDVTPKLTFKWKKDGKLSKDLVCYLSSKSTAPEGLRKKHSASKEPDITLALFQQGKYVTVYEPNLSRVDLEDPKGFEVVLLLSAMTIKDMFFSNLRDTFNLTSMPRRGESGDRQKKTSPTMSGASPAPGGQLYHTPSPPAGMPPASSSGLPPTDPFTQWQIDAETARLRAQVEAEARAEEQARQRRESERRRAESAERERIVKMLEQEGREERRRQQEVEKETARLRKLYGIQGMDVVGLPPQNMDPNNRPGLPPRPGAPPGRPQSVPPPSHRVHWPTHLPTFHRPPPSPSPTLNHQPPRPPTAPQQYPPRPYQPPIQPYQQPFPRPTYPGPYLHPAHGGPPASQSGFFQPPGPYGPRPNNLAVQSSASLSPVQQPGRQGRHHTGWGWGGGDGGRPRAVSAGGLRAKRSSVW